MSGLLLLGVGQSRALSPETLMPLDLLKAKGVINQQEAEEYARTLEGKAPAASEEDHHHSGVQSLSDRVARLEWKTGALTGVFDRVLFSGLVEVAASTARTRRDAAGHKRNSSDVTLSPWRN